MRASGGEDAAGESKAMTDSEAFARNLDLLAQRLREPGEGRLVAEFGALEEEYREPYDGVAELPYAEITETRSARVRGRGLLAIMNPPPAALYREAARWRSSFDGRRFLIPLDGAG